MKCHSKITGLLLLGFCFVTFQNFTFFPSGYSLVYGNIKYKNKAQLMSEKYAAQMAILQNTYKLMTYNIHKGVGLGSLDRAYSEKEELESLNKIKNLIASENPDILVLQEVDYYQSLRKTRDQVGWLAKNLGYPYVVMYPVNRNQMFCIDEKTKSDICAKIPKYDFNYYPKADSTGNALLSKYPITQSMMMKLPRINLQTETQRVLGVATIQLRNNKAIEIWSTHLEVSTQESRNDQVKEIISLIERKNTVEPMILVGDFNMDPHKTAKKIDLDSFLRLSQVLNFIPYKVDQKNTTITGKSDIDHILYKGSNNVHLQGSNYRVLEDPVGASDHKPVVLNLFLKTN